jgi:hypothetical protein
MLNSFETEVNLAKKSTNDSEVSDKDTSTSSNAEDTTSKDKQFDIDTVLCTCVN